MAVQSYDFNLDLHPSQRWVHIFQANQDKILKAKSSIKQLLVSMNFGTVETFVSPVITTMNSLNKILHSDEIECIARQMGMSFNEVLILQLIYEASSACTSAVLNIGGKPLFFRTMDWPMKFLKDITIKLNIKRNGHLIGTGITWIGYVGLLTATHIPNPFSKYFEDDHQLYSIAVNFRRTKEMTLTQLLKNAYKTSNMDWPVGYLVRNMIELEYSYGTTIDLLSLSKLISPCYLTLCSSDGSGIVLTRDADKLVSNRNSNLIQTNCDYDRTEPNILFSVERRELIKKIEIELNDHINSYPMNLNLNYILNKLLVNPILNNETIYCYYWFDGADGVVTC